MTREQVPLRGVDLTALTPECVEVIELLYVERVTEREAAERLGVSRALVRQRRDRALFQALRSAALAAAASTEATP